MNFDFTSEQEMLGRSVGRLMQTSYSFADRRRYAGCADGFSRDVWKQYSNMGLLGLLISPSSGGIGGTAVDLIPVMGALGKSLALEPYLSTAVLGARIIDSFGTDSQKSDLVDGILSGGLCLALAHFEQHSGHRVECVSTTAHRVEHGWRLDGAKAVVLHGNSADAFLVSARTSGSANDTHGISLFIVKREAVNLRVVPYRLIDAQGAADLILDAVVVPDSALIAAEGEAMAAIMDALDLGIAALCAEAVGIMESVHDLTLTYLKSRKQFGYPLGSFQALQHRMAELLVAIEQSRSMCFLAAIATADQSIVARRKAIAAAKVQISNSAKLIGQQCVQLHGGIGVTDEYIVGNYFKRLTVIETIFGDANYHREVFAASSGSSD